jgi:glycosyltransferase involved in cell wall biosynthesis
MVFVFWQGIISIHQKSFLEALALQPGVSGVLLVVEEEITPYRKNMGWEAPVIEHVTIIKSPAREEIIDIVKKYKEAVHVTGGLRVGAMMATAMDACIKYKCRLGIMTEPYNNAGLKGQLRTLKYNYYKIRYFKYLQFALAIGRQGVAQYKALGFEARHLFPWAYFISLNKDERKPGTDKAIRRIIYAGRLEEGKGIYRFVAELIKSGRKNYVMDLFGSGEDEAKLKSLVAEHGLTTAISFYPFLKYDELLAKYPTYDWVALPSTQKDGWGVIVSEGLLNGLKAICSGICGVSWAIKDGYNGMVFDWAKEGSCATAIATMLDDDSFALPAEISERAEKTISGEAGVWYFLRIMDCVYEQGERPAIPWVLV